MKKLLVFAGSLRKDSYNKKNARLASKYAAEFGAQVEYIDLKDYLVPVYDGDVEVEHGIPEHVKALGQKIREADALIISTPEYNGGIPGILKNIIDWLSREKPVSLTDKNLLLLGVSTGPMSAVRSLWHSRQPFEVLNVYVYPKMLGLGMAAEAFDEQGNLKDAKKADQLRTLIGQYLEYLKK
jgi:chromate reductase